MVLHTKELNNRKIITIKSLTDSYLLRELQKVITGEEGKTEKLSHFWLEISQIKELYNLVET